MNAGARCASGGQVEAEVLRAAEGVATDARREQPARILHVEVREAVRLDAGEVAARSDEGFVARVFERAAEVTRRTGRAERRAAGRACALARLRRPGKARVPRHDAAQLKPSEHFAKRVFATAEEGQLPHARVTMGCRTSSLRAALGRNPRRFSICSGPLFETWLSSSRSGSRCRARCRRRSAAEARVHAVIVEWTSGSGRRREEAGCACRGSSG